MEIIKRIYGRFTVLHLYENSYHFGSVELYQEEDNWFIENIFIEKEYRGKGYLRRIIDYLIPWGNLKCLPLLEHVEKFRHLGFKVDKIVKDDVYYHLPAQICELVNS